MPAPVIKIKRLIFLGRKVVILHLVIKVVILQAMNEVIIISPSNTAAIKAINKLIDAKAAFRDFIAKGGKPKDFKKSR